MGKYPGDTPSKRIARGLFWLCAQRPTREHPALVLASSEGGDVRLLNALGVEPDAIVAVDLCADSLKRCRAELGDIARFEHGEVADVADRMDLQPSVSFLDFCASANPGTMSSLLRVADRTIGTIGYVLSGAHEQRKWKVPVCSFDEYMNKVYATFKSDHGYSVNRNDRRKLRKLARKMIAEHGMAVLGESCTNMFPGIRLKDGNLNYHPRYAIDESDPNWGLDDGEEVPKTALAMSKRVEAIRELLDLRLGVKRDLYFGMELAVRYVGHRTPMVLGAGSVVTWSEYKEHKDAPYMKTVLPANIDEGAHGRIVALWSSVADSGTIASLFGISKERAVALKAVGTRSAKEYSKHLFKKAEMPSVMWPMTDCGWAANNCMKAFLFSRGWRAGAKQDWLIGSKPKRGKLPAVLQKIADRIVSS